MAGTSADVKVTPGSGANVATYSFTEDAETKQLQRVVLSDSLGVEKGTSSSPIPISMPLAAQVNGQYKVTASAVALGSNVLINGIVLKAKAANAGTIWIGGAGVTTTDDGTGTGFALLPGDSMAVNVANTNTLYVIGTANDVLYFAGN